MNIEDKMNNLRKEAIATSDERYAAFYTYSAACLASDAAWDAYMAASETARKTADTANDYEFGEYRSAKKGEIK